MIVFIAEEHFDYEGFTILGVYATKQEAVTRAEAVRPQWDGRVTAWEVGQPAGREPLEVWPHDQVKP